MFQTNLVSILKQYIILLFDGSVKTDYNYVMAKKKVTIESLAGMMKTGFDEMTGEMTGGFTKVNQDLEEIKLKLDNVAYRFELQELQRRVELLERKARFK